MGYCDIHCHILPGVDDGAKDMQESLDMIEIASRSGITGIVLRPHYKLGRLEHGKERFLDKFDTGSYFFFYYNFINLNDN